ncbi:hypothetical protein SAMN05421820_105141 [Pedobacter steynii]|uniref:Uncharacterized protein n=1 Tax=Pedobacter steynii TaxID=430522 RepID=A0A1G9WEY5_9SPHI|nr:hypothetical protein [Pedobacter steynii]NQX40264.1 hypothetical protein [Pedobacter steynii]SDM82595.1 hypothetical protein SAMN05421820_105141 [Pedobacter steynii]
MNAPLTALKNQRIIDAIVTFLREIGLEVLLERHEGDSFLPGIRIKTGGLSIDPSQVLYPGDILHEAGHLATVTYAVRCKLDGELPDIDLHRGAELMSLAWSYAACLKLEIPPHVVFHQDGYKGDGDHLIRNFEDGIYIGLPMLQYQQMAYDEKNAGILNVKSFPYMQNWICIKEERGDDNI